MGSFFSWGGFFPCRALFLALVLLRWGFDLIWISCLPFVTMEVDSLSLLDFLRVTASARFFSFSFSFSDADARGGAKR